MPSEQSERPGADELTPTAKFNEREEFSWKLTFRDQMAQMAGAAVVLLLLSGLLALALLHVAGIDSVWLAALIAVLFTGLCVVLKSRQFSNKFAKRTLILDPRGVSYRDRDFTVDLPWERVHAIGIVPELGVLHMKTRGGRRIAAAANAAQGGSSGLVGAGTLTASGAASTAFRAQLRQNVKAMPVDPQTGQPAFGVPLAPFDRSWRAGRIGQWVERYRPGLPLQEVVAEGR